MSTLLTDYLVLYKSRAFEVRLKCAYYGGAQLIWLADGTRRTTRRMHCDATSQDVGSPFIDWISCNDTRKDSKRLALFPKTENAD